MRTLFAVIVTCTVACWSSAGKPPTTTPVANAPAVKQRCPQDRVTGAIYGSYAEDEEDEPLAGATIVLSNKHDEESTADSDTAITDELGSFSIQRRPDRHTITVYFSDHVFESRIPDEPCDLVVLISLEGPSGEVRPLVFESTRPAKR